MKQCSVCKKEFRALWKAKTREHGAMCKICWGKRLDREERIDAGIKSGRIKEYTWDQYKKRKAISPVSDKKAKELAKYRKLRDEYLVANDRCEARIEGVCVGGPVDLHHRAPRAFNLCNVDIFSAVCRPCHNYIHDNSEWSFKKGFLLSKHNDHNGKDNG